MLVTSISAHGEQTHHHYQADSVDVAKALSGGMLQFGASLPLQQQLEMGPKDGVSVTPEGFHVGVLLPGAGGKVVSLGVQETYSEAVGLHDLASIGLRGPQVHTQQPPSMYEASQVQVAVAQVGVAILQEQGHTVNASTALPPPLMQLISDAYDRAVATGCPANAAPILRTRPSGAAAPAPVVVAQPAGPPALGVLQAPLGQPLQQPLPLGTQVIVTQSETGQLQLKLSQPMSMPVLQAHLSQPLPVLQARSSQPQLQDHASHPMLLVAAQAGASSSPAVVQLAPQQQATQQPTQQQQQPTQQQQQSRIALLGQMQALLHQADADDPAFAGLAQQVQQLQQQVGADAGAGQPGRAAAQPAVSMPPAASQNCPMPGAAADNDTAQLPTRSSAENVAQSQATAPAGAGDAGQAKGGQATAGQSGPAAEGITTRRSVGSTGGTGAGVVGSKRGASQAPPAPRAGPGADNPMASLMSPFLHQSSIVEGDESDGPEGTGATPRKRTCVSGVGGAAASAEAGGATAPGPASAPTPATSVQHVQMQPLAQQAGLTQPLHSHPPASGATIMLRTQDGQQVPVLVARASGASDGSGAPPLDERQSLNTLLHQLHLQAQQQQAQQQLLQAQAQQQQTLTLQMPGGAGPGAQQPDLSGLIQQLQHNQSGTVTIDAGSLQALLQQAMCTQGGQGQAAGAAPRGGLPQRVSVSIPLNSLMQHQPDLMGQGQGAILSMQSQPPPGQLAQAQQGQGGLRKTTSLTFPPGAGAGPMGLQFMQPLGMPGDWQMQALHGGPGELRLHLGGASPVMGGGEGYGLMGGDPQQAQQPGGKPRRTSGNKSLAAMAAAAAAAAAAAGPPAGGAPAGESRSPKFHHITQAPDGRWKAQVWSKGKIYYSRRLVSPYEAARAADLLLYKAQGPQADLNMGITKDEADLLDTKPIEKVSRVIMTAPDLGLDTLTTWLNMTDEEALAATGGVLVAGCGSTNGTSDRSRARASPSGWAPPAGAGPKPGAPGPQAAAGRGGQAPARRAYGQQHQIMAMPGGHQAAGGGGGGDDLALAQLAAAAAMLEPGQGGSEGGGPPAGEAALGGRGSSGAEHGGESAHGGAVAAEGVAAAAAAEGARLKEEPAADVGTGPMQA